VAIVLYTRSGCARCDAKRAELAARGAPVREINVSERPEAIPELLKVTRGRRIVPVVVDGTQIEVAPEGGSSF